VLKVLLDMGAQYGQGYLFQRPEPLLDVETAPGAEAPAPQSHIA
jgi:EAL domain-containing protein (putative c-di-GMP-specific phosphodiesterase class I)